MEYIKNKKARVIAYYLPQFHPIQENDKWWGKGFTEWTSVGRARKYFIGHKQPKVPADLGYYDLRLSQVREEQATLAKEAGVDAFCYWHYWLGNGKQLLEMPLQEVTKSGKPDFPFCLGWANHSWTNKEWNIENSSFVPKIMIEQVYPGKEDIDQHFYKMLVTFKDKRYYKIHEKLLFLIFRPSDIPDFEYFKNRWNELAIENDLPGFFFIAYSQDINDIKNEIYKKYDAISLARVLSPWIGTEQKSINIFKSFIIKNILAKIYSPWGKDKSFKLSFLRFIMQFFSKITGYAFNVVNYSKAIQRIDTSVYKEARVYPNIIPNWDPSPRKGPSAYIYKNSTPELFKKHVKQILSYLTEKENEDKILFLKSWNEWGEGNYIEPDLEWGKKYISVLREVLEYD